MKDSLANWRNRAFHTITTWLGSWLPSREYAAYIRGATEYGLRAAARDVREGRDAPADWRL